MDSIDLINEKRISSFKELNSIIGKFSDFFEKKGVKKEKQIKITSRIDPSVKFIGSHISVFKQYLIEKRIPQLGIFMVQNCLRTQNLEKIYDDEYVPHWASYFPSLGVLYPINLKEKLFDDIFEFFKIIGVSQDFKINISSADKDLIELCKPKYAQNLMIDSQKLSYYRHTIGISGIIGRNFNIALRNASTGSYSDVGNFIVLEMDGQPIGFEIALGASNITKQLLGLDHVLECFPIFGLDTHPLGLHRKLEDCILVSIVLYHEGLRPHSKKNPNRTLKDYMKAIGYFAIKFNLTKNQLNEAITNFEINYFPSDNKLNVEIVEKVNYYTNLRTIGADI